MSPFKRQLSLRVGLDGSEHELASALKQSSTDTALVHTGQSGHTGPMGDVEKMGVVNGKMDEKQVLADIFESTFTRHAGHTLASTSTHTFPVLFTAVGTSFALFPFPHSTYRT